MEDKEERLIKKESALNEYFLLSEWEHNMACGNLNDEIWGRIDHAIANPDSNKKFNITNENIEWAKYSWNPVTGCLHGCPYCFARDIANRRYAKGPRFNPAIWPERFGMPYSTRHAKGNNRVFLGSMTDLFGEWVPDEWIDKIMDVVRQTPRWLYLVLTKNPSRYLHLPQEPPSNMWLGMTADTNDRFNKCLPFATQLKKKVQNIIFVSFEPLKEKIIIDAPLPFDWVIIGGQSRSTGEPKFQPKQEWVEEILLKAKENCCPRYVKPNLKATLTSRPKEIPDCTFVRYEKGQGNA